MKSKTRKPHKQNSKISVIVPTYNEKENIANLINKILELRIKNLHIVVADDNRPDGTWKPVQEISKKTKNNPL